MIKTVIWNTTFNCPWDCRFCCVDAGKDMREEMRFEQKIAVADNLAAMDCRVDLSGGEVMSNAEEHLVVLAHLSAGLGKERVGLSCSGWGIDDAMARRLAGVVGDVEMTMDAHPDVSYVHRPTGYHRMAAHAAQLLKKSDVSVGLQTVVTREHLNDPQILHDLYVWLCENEIDNWSILKFFPSGRGADCASLELTDDENRRVVDFIYGLDASNPSFAKPKIDVHYLMPGTRKSPECRCVRKSVGILPDGTVTACFWGLAREGELSDNKFYLGNVCADRMDDILSGACAEQWLQWHGGCALNMSAAA